MSEGKPERCGWVSDLPHFYEAAPRAICLSLEAFISDAGQSQVRAWGAMVDILHREFGAMLAQDTMAKEYSAILEYELPREGGRRPDVVVLENGAVAVLEFKGTYQVRRADLDQASAYARDLRNYHAMCRDTDVAAILVPSGLRSAVHQVDDVTVCPPNQVNQVLSELAARPRDRSGVDAAAWVDADYSPLPSIVQAARDLYHGKPLPRIRRAHSARLPEVHALLTKTAHAAARAKERHIVILTGVPGAGKTLAGLQFVHSKDLDDLMIERPGGRPTTPAVFLSGNGPLVAVLQHALGKNKTFVQDMRAYIKEYAFKKRALAPPEHVVVFDEAQRAWDAEQVEAKHGRRATEPEMIIEVMERIPGWCVLLALVGEGQEIHRGEEAGLRQWRDAIQGSAAGGSWIIHAPPAVTAVFEGLPNAFHPDDLLNLSSSLRSRAAIDLHEWVRLLLDGGLARQAEAAKLAAKLQSEGFVCYLTRDLESAKDYLRRRYEGHPDCRYGLLASSQARNLERLGVDNSYMATMRVKYGPWFNDAPEETSSCCSFDQVVTEFGSQGLELDLPLVCWGDDFVWSGDGFTSRIPKRTQLRDPHQIRINSYRVLLTRGRDGICVFVPPDQGDGMDRTAEALLHAGFVVLQDPVEDL